jgi:hypothetical protein
VVTEQPEIAEPGDGLLRRIFRARVVELLIGLVRGEFGQERLDVAIGVADALERVLAPQFLEDARERRVVPFRDLVRAVVRDRVCRRIEVAAVEPGHGHLAEPERLRRLEPRVAGDDLPARPRHDRLPEAEPPDGRRDVRDRWVVLARVRRRAEEPLDPDRLDAELRGLQVHEVSPSGTGLTWREGAWTGSGHRKRRF